MKRIMDGNEAAAKAAARARIRVYAGYEITPFTKVSERIAEDIANGKLKARYIPAESEHSAATAALGVYYAGVRSFLGSCSQGLLFMYEPLWSFPLLRLPCGGVVPERAIGLPFIIKSDNQDILSLRDSGWIQFFAESPQEIFDRIIMGYKIGEDKRIRLPFFVGYEGFEVSASKESVDVPSQELVDEFLPAYQPTQEIDFNAPKSLACLVDAEPYFKMKIDIQQAMERVLSVSKEVQRDFQKTFGRNPAAVEKFHWDDEPKIALVTSGGPTSTARYVLSKQEFKDVGLLKIGMFRPFPAKEIRDALENVEKVAVIDRNISLGNKGIFCQELESALFPLKERPMVQGFVTGLGGYDISPQIIKEAIDYTHKHKIAREVIWLPIGIEKQIPRRKQELKEVGGIPEELVCPGHNACQGCAIPIGLKHVLKILGLKTCVVISASCSTIIFGLEPQTALRVPLFHTLFAGTASTASGIEAGLKMRGIEDVNVLGWAGDGGTEIGFSGLSGLAERLSGEKSNIIYVCVDNEAYMNTGGQRSASTPYGAQTTTTPLPMFKMQPKKPLVEIMAAHRIPFAANASIAFLDDLRSKVEIAKNIEEGLKFINLLVPCPTTWGFPSSRTIEMARLAVETGIFPLYYVLNGRKWVVLQPKFLAVEEYLKAQKRFAHLTKEQVETIKEAVKWEWDWLRKLSRL